MSECPNCCPCCQKADELERRLLDSSPPPAGDATLREETVDWRREHLRMNWMTALEHAAALFDRWLAQPAAPAASSSSREVAERIVLDVDGPAATRAEVDRHRKLITAIAAALDAERRARGELEDAVLAYVLRHADDHEPADRLAALADRIRTARTAPPAGEEQ